MVMFVRLIDLIVHDDIQAWRINVKDEMFKGEWDKENVLVLVNNKDSKCYVMSEDISNS